MAENVYECLFILDANAYARDPAKAADTVAKLVSNCEGTMLASRLWNEQKLAYPIKGRHKGAYWLSYFRLHSRNLSALNRSCQLTDIILRHLIIKIDPRLVDPLVAAAKGEATVEAPSADEAPESVPAESVEDEAATTVAE